MPLLFVLLGLTVGTAVADGDPTAAFRDCDGCPEMIVVPGGEFVMGAHGGEPGRPEGPPREVRVERDFALGKYEITNAEFGAFVAATGYEVEKGCRGKFDGEWQNHPEPHWADLMLGQGHQPDHPVACVSWLDARAYVDWLAEMSGQPYRLPTEAEWEYAARAGAVGSFTWGEDPEAACAYANVYDASADPVHDFGWQAAECDDGYPTLAPVGRFRPNAFGLYDVAGNVWEWVEDCYVEPYTAELPTDGSALEVPPGQCERRGVRGGGWITRPDRQRLTFRGRDPEDIHYTFFGLRVARSLSTLEN
ncbi:MAG: formylglycine-generating enzyme family protein [Gammaproteobacteria bacterium]|nr:formylglycine-generating enzyme family protein [Gammaproteobacteria bacterium]